MRCTPGTRPIRTTAPCPTDAERDDIDAEALRDYRRQRAQANPDADELAWTDDELLLALGCARKGQGRLQPTLAGILLFGTAKALRRCLPMMRIDYIRVPGRRWVENPEHRFDTLEIRAPLLTAIRRATNAVRDELMQTFSLPEGSLARTDEPSLPLRVIREAVVNAVMHRSYRIHGPVQIIRYANRLEIRNPGHSIKAEEQLGEPGSETRNPRVAAVLHDVNIAETKGSGIRAMRELMLAQDLLPTFESSRRPDQFVATLLFHHFLGPSDLNWLRRLSAEPLSDEDARALVFLREAGAIDSAAYRSINRTDTLTASARLRRLRDLGIMDMKGSGSRTYYLPSLVFAQTLIDPPADGANGHQVGPDGHQPRPNSHLLAPIDRLALSAIPPELTRRIPPEGAKPRRDLIRRLLMDLCAWRALSARELSAILRRKDHKPLVRDHLTPMVAAGTLAYTFPAMEKHPDQKYTVPPTPVAPDQFTP